jgi:hypothetical protein
MVAGYDQKPGIAPPGSQRLLHKYKIRMMLSELISLGVPIRR